MYLVYITKNTFTVTLLKLNVKFRLSWNFIYTKQTPYHLRYGVSPKIGVNTYSLKLSASLFYYTQFLAYILQNSYVNNN